jgi:hypothetical protein
VPHSFAKLAQRLAHAARVEEPTAGAALQGEKLPVRPIGKIVDRQWTRVAGTVRSVTYRPPSTSPAFEVDLDDGTGVLRVVWIGQRDIPGVAPGRRLMVEGRVSRGDDRAVLRDPRYELLGSEDSG